MITIRNQHETSTTESSAADLAPMRIMEVELGQPLPHVSAVDAKTGQHYQRALCVVRLHTEPLGTVELSFDADGLGAEDYAQQIWHALNETINEHLRQDGLSAVSGLNVAGLPDIGMPRCLQERELFLADAPFVSVIVPTRNRPERLQLCLRSLLALDYPHYEVIVVDNTPNTSASADIVEQIAQDAPQLQVRYLREDRPGPSSARNTGIMAAKGEILAFTDDDVVVDSYWLVELVRGFSLTKDITCVTGLVLPLELETPAQFWFEEYGGFNKGFIQRIFDRREYHPKTPLYPYAVGRFGTGASMACTRAFLHCVNGFDMILAGNSQAPGAEDVNLFFQTIMRGYKLVYRPTSLAYHQHRRDYTILRKQIHHYGVGLTAHVMKIMHDNPLLLFDIAAKVPPGLYYSLNARSSKNSKKSTTYPKELTTLELKGMLYGPFSYLRSWWIMRNISQESAPNTYIVQPIKSVSK